MNNELTLKDFKEILVYMLSNNKKLIEKNKLPIAIGVESPAGIGKTSVIEQTAEELGMTYVKISMSELEEVGDLAGFPLKEFKINELAEDKSIITTKWIPSDLLSVYTQMPCGTYEFTGESRMSYATPAWLPREENPNGIILNLDDYTRAQSYLLQATMELINTGKFHTWSLPKNTFIVLTSNPDNADYNLSSLDEAQKTRFVNFPVKFDIEEWAKWAEYTEIDGRAINFALSYFTEIFEKNDGVDKINARSYTMFCNSISGIEDWSKLENLATILNISKGCFKGNSIIGRLFTLFINNKLDKLIQPKELLLNSWKTVQPKIQSCVYNNTVFHPEIASILATRLLNYTEYYFTQPGVKSDVVQQRLLDIIDASPYLFTEDLIFNIAKTLIVKYPSRMQKLIMNPKIREKVL